MNTLAALPALVLHLALVLLLAPTVAGLLAATRARLAGQAGPPWTQPWRDLARLARKAPTVADPASDLAGFAPGARLALLLAAAALVPSFAHGTATDPWADLLLVLGLLGLARALLSLAALDGGSSASANAAASMLTRAARAAPIAALAVLVFGLFTQGSHLPALATATGHAPPLAHLPLVLAILALGWPAIVDTSLGPMRGAVAMTMDADFSGRDLALLRFGDMLLVVIWLTLLAALLPPFGRAAAANPTDWPLALLAWLGKLLTLTAMVVMLQALGRRWTAAEQAEGGSIAQLAATLGSLLALALMGRA
jgi:formate hydrogenlyase subunit 4